MLLFSMFLNNNVRVQTMGIWNIYEIYLYTTFLELLIPDEIVYGLNNEDDHEAHFFSPSPSSPSIFGTMSPAPPVQSIGSCSPSLQVA